MMEDGTTRTQFVEQDPAGLRWNDAGEPSPYRTTPLFDEAAREAARDEGYAIGRETEADYWRSMVERLTAQADEWNRRYMALLQQVADSRAMQPAPAILVDLGPNAELTGRPLGARG